MTADKAKSCRNCTLKNAEIKDGFSQSEALRKQVDSMQALLVKYAEREVEWEKKLSQIEGFGGVMYRALSDLQKATSEGKVSLP